MEASDQLHVQAVLPRAAKEFLVLIGYEAGWTPAVWV
jgi:hypothetical protein